MKTFLSTLAITLAITFMATPAYALDDLAKCRVYNAKIKMNYAKCLELDQLLVEKGKAPKGNCDSKRTASLEKATAKFVTKLDVNDVACGIDTETAAGDQALQWLASGDGSLTTRRSRQPQSKMAARLRTGRGMPACVRLPQLPIATASARVLAGWTDGTLGTTKVGPYPQPDAPTQPPGVTAIYTVTLYMEQTHFLQSHFI